ncbi:hypothetical protein DMC64_19075 [Amycolatopsis sp. WAC 04197]|nr:hypothetical protein DMC64_19075 [Amycolatopsis sp. WAC 04197]
MGGVTVTVTGGGTEVDGVAVTVVIGVGVIAGTGTWFGGDVVQAPAATKTPKTSQRLMASSARVPT